jgi:hypothetical protein
MKPPIKPTAQVDHYQILSVLFKRYAELAQTNAEKLDGLPAKCQSGALVSLCKEAIANGKDYPFDKMNRWLGFAQGVLATTGIIDVDSEREYTRPLLHQLHLEPVKSWPRKLT